MYYKNKTPYGARVIRVTEILLEREGEKSDYDRVFHFDVLQNTLCYMYRSQFEQDYEPLSDSDFCSTCGSVITNEKSAKAIHDEGRVL